MNYSNYNLHMVYKIYSHCSYCGAAFPENTGWPRTCANCGNTSFRNPLPVAVVLVPVILSPRLKPQQTGILVIRRAIAPKVGELALPGGFINFGETWQEAGAREVFEETGARIAPDEIRVFGVRSARDGTLIIFGLAQPRPVDSLPPFVANDECSDRLVLTGPEPMAFPSHAEMIEVFLKRESPAR